MPRDTAASRTAPPGLAVTIGQHSAAGRKPANQDFHGAVIPTGTALALKGIALALADGISPSPVSAEAAETAVKSLLTDYYATPDAWTVKTAAGRVIAATNAWLAGINARSGDDLERGRVCTLSALILKGAEAHLFHVGDARIHRRAGDTVEPLTRDHSLRLAGGGTCLGRAMGLAPQVEIDHRRLPLAAGDVFLLTTDGVHQHLAPRDLARLLAHEPQAAAEAITAAALAAGSPDNVTAQVVRIDALPAEAPRLAEDLPVPPLPRPGDAIDGFRILRPLAASARSHVFLARAPDGSRLALKIPAAEIAADPQARARFLLEDWIARRVASPHLLQPGPRPERQTALYVTSAFLPGITLRQWLTDRPRPTLAEVRDIAGQIAAGLRALHRREMIHQDLRPENVMIDPDGTVRIVDLGSCSVAGVDEAAPGLLGQMPGTFQYTAPEYLSGEPGSWRSDQYALGVVVYEMLTGRLPYGAQVARVRSRADQRRLRYVPAADETSGVPGWVDAALRRATHPDPLRRYDALGEFLADLARPGSGWRAARARPLIERDPARFWQAVSALLALAVILLAAALTLGPTP